MRRYLAIAVVLALAAVAAPAPAEELPGANHVPLAGPAGNHLFAGGGTNVSNGIFFPGTATCGKDGCQTVGGLDPLIIGEGTDITFTNVDPAAVTNGHRIVSIERKKKGKKKGKPLFFSEQVDGPGQTTVKTRQLKPGTYFYLCSTHFGMYGAIEVVEGM